MQGQRVFVIGRTFAAGEPALQDALAALYDTPERPRCMCVPGGIELYISKRSTFVLARMPGTGGQHHPSCHDYEPAPGTSGRGALIDDAIVQRTPDSIDVFVNFPLSRCSAKAIPRGEASAATEVRAPKHRMSLQALLHTLYEDARFNRWYPAMEGARNQAVLCKYLSEAATRIFLKNEPLGNRLYVPEPFNADQKSEIAQRRRDKLAFLNASEQGGRFPFGIVIGEFKNAEVASAGVKVWIKHMPDAPLFMDAKPWGKVERVYQSVLEARDADVPRKPRILIAAVIYARRENVYRIERLTMMLVSDRYIPLEGTYELPLLDKLCRERRSFSKPLKYDSANGAAFANFLLFDVRDDNGRDLPLHVISAFADDAQREAKQRAMAEAGQGAWVWHTDQAMPDLPAPGRYRVSGAAEQDVALDAPAQA